MTRNGSDSDPRHVFGQALRHLRTQAGMSQEQLGRAAFISGDMIAKVERGDRSPSAKLVEAFEQVTDLGSNGMLSLLWVQLGGFTRPFPGWFARWPDAESAARTLRWFEPLIIPGLLQTEDYARALLSTRVGESEEQIDAMVAARLARQGVLDRDKPPTCWFMLDEGVLRRCVGSPVVMKEQLIQLAGWPSGPISSSRSYRWTWAHTRASMVAPSSSRICRTWRLSPIRTRRWPGKFSNRRMTLNR